MAARWAIKPGGSVQLKLKRVVAILEITEQIGQIGVVHRLTGLIRQKVLLRHVSHVIALIIFSQQVVKRLVLGRAAFLWNGIIPCLCVGKHCIHVKDNTTERVLPMSDHLTDMIFGLCLQHSVATPVHR